MTQCEQMLLTADWAAFIAQGFILYNDINHAAAWMRFSQRWRDQAYDLTIADGERLAA